MGEGAVIHVCQGPPRCLLEGDDAVKAQENDCVWCSRLYFNEDGTETEIGPYDEAVEDRKDKDNG